MDAPPPVRLPKILGLTDVVLMNVVAVVGLRWIARGARAGAPSVTLWVLAWLAFFLPLALALSALSRRYPEQGGIYAWTRRAFGPAHGYACGWCLWVNNLFYFPSLLLFAAANAVAPLGARGAALADSRAYSVVFVLAALWFCVAVNVVGLRMGRWIQNIGSVGGTWLPAAVLIIAGAVALALFGSATSFNAAALVPRADLMGTLSLWSAMCFAFSGFEITSMVGQEVKDPTRTLPRGVVIGGLVTSVIYIVGSVAVLVTIPASALSERSGITDAIALVTARVGIGGVAAATGVLLAIGSIAGTSSWFAGAGRVPFAAGVDRVLPQAFARLHSRFHTPHIALLVQGIAASALFLTSVFLSIAGARTTVQEAYDILVNLTILIYFIPYLYLFAALVRLDRPASARTRLTAIVGFLSTAIALALLFVPPEGTTNVLNYEMNLVLQAAALFGLGAALYWSANRGRSPAERS